MPYIHNPDKIRHSCSGSMGAVLCVFIFSFFLVWLPLTSFKVRAQTAQGGSYRMPVSQTFRFQPAVSERDEIVNDMLQRLAETSGKLRISTWFAIEGDLVVNYFPQINQRCLVYFSLQNLRFTGDIHYRDFSLERVLVPDMADIVINMEAGAGVPQAYRENLRNVLLTDQHGQNTESAQWFSLDCSRSDMSFGIESYQLFYTDDLNRRFQQWATALQQYYQSHSQLDRVEALIADLKYNDPDEIVLQEFRLCEAEDIMASQTYAGFRFWIDPEHPDPEGVYPRYNNIKNRMDSLRLGFNQALSEIDRLFYAKGQQLARQGNMAGALMHYEKALEYNPFMVEANLALIEKNLGDGLFEASLLRMGRVLSLYFPSGTARTQAEALSTALLNRIYAYTDSLQQGGLYLDALRLLLKTEAFCDTVQSRYLCPSGLNNRIARAHEGMFNSYLRVAERALRNDNPSYALGLLESAWNYHQDHKQYIPSPGKASVLLQQLVNRHLESAARLILDGRFTEASVFLQTARELCTRFDFLYCP